ncbi:hypothetical protein EJ08DRAFT_595682 [Tothia fuscella]|uniref:Uncharacterized protein n=1 Tax=Tothia fuscella TaxID=1048955 RepID=A0A9P4NJD2_9PEZI|nr:hypothetical protein EJ08DRAFT_595682 [Tothia fuscella]
MSWMDSWSRPGKHATTPPPLYLTQGDSVKYCHTCGRVMSSRKTQQAETKYCSSRCRNQKPKATDKRIEDAFVALLNEESTFEGEPIPSEIRSTKSQKKTKGDTRIIIPCSAAETLLFGSRHDPTKTHGRKKNKAPRALDSGEWKSVDMESDEEEDTRSEESLPEHLTVGFAGKVRPPQNKTDINGGIGGEKGWAERSEETEEDAAKRREGQKVAEERESVKRAARRGCIFGFLVEGWEEPPVRRKCEAVMNGAVVEPSFAKGDWGIRWRE